MAGLTTLIGACIPFFGGLLGFFGGLVFAPTSYFVSVLAMAILEFVNNEMRVSLWYFSSVGSLYYVAHSSQAEGTKFSLDSMLGKSQMV